MFPIWKTWDHNRFLSSEELGDIHRQLQNERGNNAADRAFDLASTATTAPSDTDATARQYAANGLTWWLELIPEGFSLAQGLDRVGVRPPSAP